MGITYDGSAASKLFCSITGFKELGRSDPRGDAQDGAVTVEIKKNNYNQVHPYKYNVLVGYHTETDAWYVIPPDDVIRLLLRTKNSVTEIIRGQHTPDPMVCVNLDIVNHAKYSKYAKTANELRQAVLDAHAQGANSTSYKQYAAMIAAEVNNVTSTRKAQIAAL